MAILNEALDNLDGKVLDGETVFKLYDTYGFPADLTNDVAREREFAIDEEGFEKAMEEQRQRAREAGQFGTDYNAAIKVDTQTEFCGYVGTKALAQWRQCSLKATKWILYLLATKRSLCLVKPHSTLSQAVNVVMWVKSALKLVYSE